MLEKFVYRVGNRVFEGMRRVLAFTEPHKHSHARENARRRAQMARGWKLSGK